MSGRCDQAVGGTVYRRPCRRLILILLLSLPGCHILGVDGREVDLRVLDRGTGSAGNSAHVVDVGPLRVRGTIQLDTDCRGIEAGLWENSDGLSLRISREEVGGEGCYSDGSWREYRATVRNLPRGPSTLHVIHDGGWFGPDTVLVEDVTIAARAVSRVKR